MKILVFILFFFCVDIHPEERVYTVVVPCQKREPMSEKWTYVKMDLCKNGPVSKIVLMSKRNLCQKASISHKSAHMSQK